jgi:ketosteroid isomerase-like protein
METYSRTFQTLLLGVGCVIGAVSVPAAPSAVSHDAHRAQASQEQDVLSFFKAYDAAFTAKNLDQLATMYHPDVTVYEGGGINPGWADYRDRHLGPELKSFTDLQFAHENVKIQMLGVDAAYATANYALRRSVDGKPVTSGGLATYVLVRQDGKWIIRHSHTSASRRPAGGSEF